MVAASTSGRMGLTEWLRGVMRWGWDPWDGTSGGFGGGWGWHVRLGCGKQANEGSAGGRHLGKGLPYHLRPSVRQRKLGRGDGVRCSTR